MFNDFEAQDAAANGADDEPDQAVDEGDDEPAESIAAEAAEADEPVATWPWLQYCCWFPP